MTRQRLPSAGSLGRLSRLLRYYALLRLLVARPASPQLPLGSTVPTEKKTFSRKRRDLPGSWVALCTYATLYDPGRIFVPSHEDDTTRGVAVPGDFRPRSDRCRCLSPCCLAVSTPRGTSILPPLFKTTRAPATSKLSGLNHAASALAVYASQPASRRTTQDALAVGGQPLLRGIGYPPGYFQGFSVSSLPPRPSFPGAIRIQTWNSTLRKVEFPRSR